MSKALFEAGYRLIPLEGRKKKPMLKGWRNAEHPASILKFYKDQGNNLGVVLQPGQVVLDFDPRNFTNGDDRAFVRDFMGIDIDSMPIVDTGGTGYGTHHYCRVPPNVRLKGRIPGLPGMDIKQVGGFVVAPGSIHEKTGQEYTLRGEWFEPPMLDVPEAWLRAEPGDTVAPPGSMTPEWLASYLANMDVTTWQDYDAWVKLLTACHHATGGDAGAREVFVEWSMGDPQYEGDDEVVRYKWDQARTDRAGGATISTLYYYAQERGFDPPMISARDAFADIITEDTGDEPTEDDNPWEVVSRNLSRNEKGRIYGEIYNVGVLVNAWQPRAQWAYNEFNGRVTARGTTPFSRADEPWGDENEAAMVIRASERFPSWNLSPKQVNLAVITKARDTSFHPVRDWLNGLSWDGVSRVDRWMEEYLDARDTDPLYLREVGRLILDAMITRVVEPGCKWDYVIVLEGEQGIGKSTICRKLAMRDEWFTDAVDVTQHPRDLIPVLRGKWLVEFGEMDHISKSRRAKAFITTQVDTARLSYGRNESVVPRQCVFIGTTNDTGYLDDETGGRRYLPIPIGNAIARMREFDRDREQLFAEAFSKWERRPLMLSPAAEAIATEAQNQRQIENPVDLKLEESLQMIEGDFVSSSYLMSIAGAKHGRDASIARRISNTMRKLGWYKSRDRQVDDDGRALSIRGYRRLAPGPDQQLN